MQAYNRGMLLRRSVIFFLFVTWTLVALYPDPSVLVRSARHVLSPPIEPGAVAQLARNLPDDPRAIEQIVLRDVVPYASDWESAGVPWAFPTTAEALRQGRGDCESRALVLASLLDAKGIPYGLRMSFDHIWVDYPGKVPTENENDALLLVSRDGGGWFGLHWPRDVDPVRDVSDQLDIYWTPMPVWRKATLFFGLIAIACWNGLAALAGAARMRGAAPSWVAPAFFVAQWPDARHRNGVRVYACEGTHEVERRAGNLRRRSRQCSRSSTVRS